MSPAAVPAAPPQSPPPQPAAADPANAAPRKTAWSVPAPPTPAAGIIAGDASWPALADSARACPKSASSDSLKSLSDGSGPSAQEDSIAAYPVLEVNPISTASNPTSTPPPNAAAATAASPQQNGAATQPNPAVRRGGTSGGNNGGGSRANGTTGSGCRVANKGGGDGTSGTSGDANWNDGSLGSGSGCNSSYSDTNSSNGAGASNLNNNVPAGGARGNGSDCSRNSPGSSNQNNIVRGFGVGGSSSNGSGNGDGNNTSSGGSSNHWDNNTRNSSGTSNGVGGRGGYRSRRDHERGGNFTPRNYPRVSVTPYQQQQHQQPGIFQPGPFHQPPLPAAHFMITQHFVPYVPPFAYHADVQSYPLYLPPMEQFQNMHLVRPPMQAPWLPPQDQLNLQENIRNQIEFYFSTNNLCHDTFLRRQMNDQGWVPINLILGFNRMRTFTGMVDTNYILEAIRGSETLEVQGNNVRRRNDWAEWLLH